MIKITSLNKIYRSKKRRKCHALNDINLTLPDAGLVFVLGKSGSGKSTLLNLIGGLDNITSGSVEVDGNDLAKFKEKDFCNYRNSHIGFIFQDYHLIDELTVYENIRLSLDLENRNEYHLIGEALARVDLAGYEERYPTELSGGEQQRVAIARAIVKKPRIILADEPTGNLDTNTARQIVELLKELSKDCLILIVSHNINDANNYADRIIELKKGRIISDKSRNPEFLDEVSLQNGELVYPQGLALSDNDIDFINNNLTKFKKKTDKFLPTAEPKSEARKVKILNKNLSLGRELNLSGKFLKSKTLAIAFSAFMVAVIMVIMALAQTIIAFDGGKIVSDEMNKSNQSSLLLNKISSEDVQQMLDKKYNVAIENGDIQAFYDAGYNGNIYPLLSITVPSNSMVASDYGMGQTCFTHPPFMSCTFGTMVVDEEFLTKKFGDLEYVARVDNFMPYGLIITDYMADSILQLNTNYSSGNKTYYDILGDYSVALYRIPTVYINGIINTGYKDEYGELFERISNIPNIKASDLYKDDEFNSFLNEVYDKLGYSFTTNINFLEDYKNSHLSSKATHYTLNFNGLVDIQAYPHAYVMDSMYNLNYVNKDNLLGGDWRFLNVPPEIPENAKYMRVAFNKNCNEAFDTTDEISTREYALLQFSNREVVSKDKLNAIIGGKGAFINPYDGSVEIDPIYGGYAAYVSEFIEIPNGSTIEKIGVITKEQKAFCAFYDENYNFISSVINAPGEILPESSIRIQINQYNKIFGTNFTDADIASFVPHQVTLSHYSYYDVEKSNPLFTKTVTIIGLLGAGCHRTMDVSRDVYELFAKDSIRIYSLYFDGTDGIGAALDAAEKLNYEPQSFAVEGIHTMTKAVDVFIPIFELIAIFLCVGVVFILVNFSSKMINDKMHEIGIMKALGTKNSSIGAIFGLQVALIAILTCILATAGYYFFIDLANDVLIESLMRLAPGHVVLDLDFLTFQPKIALENCVLVGALALISLIFPMIKIKAIKPVKIIKAKD